MDPTPWTEIEGGRDALLVAFRSVEAAVVEKQGRFARYLDALGPPGRVSWDPIGGTLDLRGRRFEVQQLGSFDGASWLWSWANTHLAIPDDKTELARGLRGMADRIGVPALREPMIEDDDEELPGLLGGLAIAHGFGDAFYVANASQVYLLAPGQLDVMPQREKAGPERLVTIFSDRRRGLAELLAHLREHESLAPLAWSQVSDDEATLAGPGLALALRRHDRLKDVLALVEERDEEDREAVRRAATVFTLEGAIDGTYAEAAYAAFFGRWTPVQGAGRGRRVPWHVIAVGEQANRLDGVVVFDDVLGTPYPR